VISELLVDEYAGTGYTAAGAEDPRYAEEWNLIQAKKLPLREGESYTEDFEKSFAESRLYPERALNGATAEYADAAAGGIGEQGKNLTITTNGKTDGAYDAVLMRCMDVLLAIPSLLLNLSIVAALGKSVFNMMLAVGVSNVPRYCRIMRASVLQIKNTEYVDAARVSGASNMFIILRHIIPNCLAPIIVQATLSVGSAIIACAGLSFLGVGIPAPIPEWGAMLSNGKDFLRHNAYITIFPGLAIMLTVLSLNLMGDGLRDAFDPKLRR